MIFNPQSTICLCNVQIDNTYQHQIFFNDRNEQKEYFYNRVRKTFANYLTVRKSLPDGSLNSFIRVDANIETLYDCNYMYYTNEHHGNKTFYAFITQLIYINEGTTEIRFETDVFQTWYFERVLKPSFVVREHTKTDKIGEHIEPEKFNFSDYVYNSIDEDVSGEYIYSWFREQFNSWGYLVATTESLLNNDVRGWELSGIYQGLYFYFYKHDTAVNNLLTYLENNFNEECVQFIACIPDFLVEGANGVANMYVDSDGTVKTDGKIYGGKVQYGDYPAHTNVQIDMDLNFERFNYIKNKKLLTAPFTNIVITNNVGDEVEYNIEDFSKKSDGTPIVRFEMYGDISASPSLTVVPANYKNRSNNYDHAISIKNFPQCSYNSDTFKLWLAKNQFSSSVSGASSALTMGAGVIGAVAMGSGIGIPLAIGGAVVAGASSIANTINEVYKASKLPNRGHAGSPSNNILSALKDYRFEIFIRMIKPEYRKMIDDYFTLYGYQVNTLKTPSINNRPYYTYVQTAGCNIVTAVNTFAIPDDDMRKLKAIFDAGLTVWKSTATIGDYSVDNSPT